MWFLGSPELIAAFYGHQLDTVAATYPALRHRECKVCEVTWRGGDLLEPGEALCWVCSQEVGA